MVKTRNLLLSMVLIFGFSGWANAAVVGFDQFETGTNINGLNLGGVTITAIDGIVRAYNAEGYVSPYNSITASSWDAGRKLTITFDNLVSFVSIVGGDPGGDTDQFSMEAFDASWNSIGKVDTGTFYGPDPLHPLNTTFGDYRLLSMNASGAKYVVLEQVTWGCLWDDLTYNPVPIPAGIFLLGSGLLGLFGLRRKV